MWEQLPPRPGRANEKSPAPGRESAGRPSGFRECPAPGPDTRRRTLTDTCASTSRRPRPYVMAMVLGTALSALSPAARAEGASPATLRTVADLSRYCTACWRNARLPADFWNDCTQEVLCRLLERVPADAWDRALKAESDEHREFVRAIDAVKKRTQRRKKWTSQALDCVADRQDGQRVRRMDERAAVERAAQDLLTQRQQSILQ